jgi:hypothetical protein
MVSQHEDDVKTECSERPMPIDPSLLDVLLNWKQQTEFASPEDYIFASLVKLGRLRVLSMGLARVPERRRSGSHPSLWSAHPAPQLSLLARRSRDRTGRSTETDAPCRHPDDDELWRRRNQSGIRRPGEDYCHDARQGRQTAQNGTRQRVSFLFSVGNGGESGIVFRPISEITATMEKSFYPFVIADTFKIAAMKSDGG